MAAISVSMVVSEMPFSRAVAINLRRCSISFEPARFKYVKLRQKLLHGMSVSGKALQDFGYHYASHSQRFVVRNHPA